MEVERLRVRKRAGEGANFIVRWQADKMINVPIIECVMIGATGGQGISFVSPGQEIRGRSSNRFSQSTPWRPFRCLVNRTHSVLMVWSLSRGGDLEPMAIVDCFGHIYRRKTDQTAINCFVDIGFKSTRAVIAEGSKILFARTIPVGGEHFNRAVAQTLGIGAELDDLGPGALFGAVARPFPRARTRSRSSRRWPPPTARPSGTRGSGSSRTGTSARSRASGPATACGRPRGVRRCPSPRGTCSASRSGWRPSRSTPSCPPCARSSRGCF